MLYGISTGKLVIYWTMNNKKNSHKQLPIYFTQNTNQSGIVPHVKYNSTQDTKHPNPPSSTQLCHREYARSSWRRWDRLSYRQTCPSWQWKPYRCADGYHHRGDAPLGSWQHHAPSASSCVWPCTCGTRDQPSVSACRYDHHRQQYLSKHKMKTSVNDIVECLIWCGVFERKMSERASRRCIIRNVIVS